jgi:hypothetical protein
MLGGGTAGDDEDTPSLTFGLFGMLIAPLAATMPTRFPSSPSMG